MAGFFNKLKNALSKTSNKIGDGIDHIFIKKKLDNKALDDLEELLITSDIGVMVASEIIEFLRKKKFDKEVTINEIKAELANIIDDILSDQQHELNLSTGLNIILVCGVNGNGKTTTIGKMAAILAKEGKKVAVAACDTFRAAAIDQLETWAERGKVTIYKGDSGTDPASIAHKAVADSQANGIDVLFIDTAGRLHNHKNLMAELAKIVKVVKKVAQHEPHHCLLVLDGTTGQNAIVQVEEFKSVADISGIIITKLDGTAKAGAVVGIVKKFKLPVHFIGIGEGIEDLKPFKSSDFAKALVGISNEGH